jgi:hypothetical protein
MRVLSLEKIVQNSDLPEEDSVPEVRDNSQVLVIKINDYFIAFQKLKIRLKI